MNYQQQLDNALAVIGRVADQNGLLEDDSAGWQQLAEAAGMSGNGPYKVLGAWTSDAVTVVLEQNTAPDVPGGPLTIYPPVAIVERHHDAVRVSVAGGDEETLQAVLDELAPVDELPRGRRGARAR